ncbi:MAG TPA: DEAD/DEAH box helicase [Bdellovibrionales bacterium]|nr:DEAD/DEAH box helicase [Bdellovibrionales bacterium]
MNQFRDLNLIEPIVKAVEAEGYTLPTPVQKQAIPIVLSRQDLLACAQTGTGKTAAFALPILQLLTEKRTPVGPPAVPGIRVLVLTPTRELATQIGESFTNYGRELRIRNTVIFGGVGQNAQVNALRRGVDIVVATPGRLLDLMNQRLIRFNGLEIFVLDEADRMLDMGFIHDVRRVITGIPKQRQTLFFSATMPPEISKLSAQILTKPVRIEVTPVASTAEKVSQAIYPVDAGKKTSLLVELLKDPKVTRSLVFTRTKREANRVAEALLAVGIGAAAIHGNKSQSAREKALAGIKTGATRVLVATDIAARGIDIDDISHVFNHDIPNIPESYVHRIGRTARAGNAGIAISFCSPQERSFMRDIERLIRQEITVLKTPEGLSNEAHKPRQGWRPVGGSGRGRPAPNARSGGRPGGRAANRPGENRYSSSNSFANSSATSSLIRR